MSTSDNDSTRSSSGSGAPSTTTITLILVVVALILVVVILFATRRFKRNASSKGTSPLPTELSSHRSTVMDRTHPSARITPFGSNTGREIPAHAFGHEPGRNMRIAVRRPDGAWDFVPSNASPYSLANAAELGAAPASRSSASLHSLSSPSSTARSKKEEDPQRWRRKEFDFDVEPDVMPPPPAYGQT